jgi:hypothetical protein
LGGVQRPLETELSPQARQLYRPLVEALRQATVGEARRIFVQVQTYAKTATRTKLFDKNETMQTLSI